MTETTGRAAMVIRSIPDAIAAVPYLLGFHPADSLVVIGYDGPHNMCAIRIDLPPPRDRAEAAEHVATVLAANGFHRALVLGYGPHDQVDPIAALTWERLTAHGLAVTDAARVSGARWWSLTCVETGCCAPSGNPYDSTSTVVAAQATLAGKVALADRAQLAASVAPLTGAARTSIRQATARAEERLKSWAREGLTGAQFNNRMTQEGQALLTRLRHKPPALLPFERGHKNAPRKAHIHPSGAGPLMPSSCDRDQRAAEAVVDGRAESTGESEPRRSDDARPGRRVRRGDGGGVSDDDIAWLGVLLTNLRVRDEAWVRIDEERLGDEIEFWRDVLRRVDERYASAPACLLAYAAYVAGDGGLANVALERADRGYSMAALLGWALEIGAPPSVVRLNMTPEDLAAAHAERDAQAPDHLSGLIETDFPDPTGKEDHLDP